MALDFSALASRLTGPVFLPGDPGYAAELAGFNTAVVHTPALVVAAASEADVAAAVAFAAQAGLVVRVQGAGHGAHAPITDGLLVSTRRLDAVSVDARARTVTVGAGVRWRAVIAAAAPHGLAPITGSSADVGVAGYLLGGGLGPLARSHGFSSDYLLGVRVVTGAGEVVTADEAQNPDLFWALRGGKLGLGVVTELRLRLVELTTLYAGSLFFAAEHIEQALRGWVEWTARAPAEVTTSVAIIRFPPFDAVPPPLRGRLLLNLRFAFPGPVEEGAHLAAPLRALAPVYLDALGPLPPAEVARIHNDPSEPAPSWVRGALLHGFDQAAVSALLAEVGPGKDAPYVAAEVRHIGAATARDVAGGSAVGGRGARYTLGLIGVNPALFATTLPAVTDRLLASLRGYLAPETNINFLGEIQGPQDLARAWPADTLARLANVRRQYDPRGVFGKMA